MKNNRENAEKFLYDFGGEKSFVDRLDGVSDLVDLLTEYGEKIDNEFIPSGAHSLEVFAIRNSTASKAERRAFIGFKLENGDFHYIGVPYTETIRIKRSNFSRFIESFKSMFRRERYIKVF